MSWSMRLVPILLLSACGGTFVTEEPSGSGGTDVGGSAGDGGSGGDESGGTSSGGASANGGKVGTGGKVGAGGSTGTGGKVASGGSAGTGGKVSSGGTGAGGAGGSTTREPAKHRPTAVSCGTPPTQLPVPDPGTGGASSGPLPPPETCMSNTDCKSGPNGRCIFGRIGQYCTYDACFTDDNCDAGAVCMCGSQSGTGNHCSQKGCRVDADCPGSWCSPTFSSCGTYSGVVGYACHTTTDECVDDTDCTSSGAGIYCMYSPMVAHWVCSSSQCAG